ncbi:hypothetical protein DKY63_24155 [Pseudomonas putida]|uniref:Uncharacterized protein n=1 Tax=Pseudomonas putida TaxID=303 RepID=A0A2Z4RSL4_PSEPU|nr:hypothetical protein DKY63_24155 [Pseudomonas putida]
MVYLQRITGRMQRGLRGGMDGLDGGPSAERIGGDDKHSQELSSATRLRLLNFPRGKIKRSQPAAAPAASCYSESAYSAFHCCVPCKSACQESLFFLCRQRLNLAWLSRETAWKHEATACDFPRRSRQISDDSKLSSHRPGYTDVDL